LVEVLGESVAKKKTFGAKYKPFRELTFRAAKKETSAVKHKPGRPNNKLAFFPGYEHSDHQPKRDRHVCIIFQSPPDSYGHQDD